MAHILIVEDDEHIRTMLQETLQLEGYQTSVAENGIQALQQCRTAKPDAVITDILMPEKEGLSFITDLRKEDAKVCIIAISGGALKLAPGCNLELAHMFGANHTFEKPLNLESLLEVLHKELSA